MSQVHKNGKFGKIPPKQFIKYDVDKLLGCMHGRTHEQTDRQTHGQPENIRKPGDYHQFLVYMCVLQS